MKRYCGNFRKNAAVQKRGADFVRACAVEMHFNMSQEPLYTKIYCTGKMPRPSWRTLMKHGPFYTCHVLVHMCSYLGPGNFCVWSVAILLQVSLNRFHLWPLDPAVCFIVVWWLGVDILVILSLLATLVAS